MKTSDISRKHRLKIMRPDEGTVNPDVKAIGDAVQPLLDWAHNARIALRKLRYMHEHSEHLPRADQEYELWEGEVRDGLHLAKRAMIMFAERLAKQERDASGR